MLTCCVCILVLLSKLKAFFLPRVRAQGSSLYGIELMAVKILCRYGAAGQPTSLHIFY